MGGVPRGMGGHPAVHPEPPGEARRSVIRTALVHYRRVSRHGDPGRSVWCRGMQASDVSGRTGALASGAGSRELGIAGTRNGILSSMSLDADVIVVGAGPAGSTAAALLATAGGEGFVGDRATFPRGKTCGGYLKSRAVRPVRRAGGLPPPVDTSALA